VILFDLISSFVEAFQHSRGLCVLTGSQEGETVGERGEEGDPN